MNKLYFSKVKLPKASTYPAQNDYEMQGQSKMALGDAGSLYQFGVKFKPSAKSSIRH